MRELHAELSRLAGDLVHIEPRPSDGLVVRGPRWAIELAVDGGWLALTLARQDWTTRRDELARVKIPEGSTVVWARRVAVNLFQTMTALEGRALEQGPRLRLMLVDDEVLLLNVLRRTLSAAHDVDVFADPLLALEAARSEDYDGLMVDYRMPRLDGLEFIARVAEVRPDLGPRCCLMTAEPERLAFVLPELMLAKPLSIADLDEVLRLFAVLRRKPPGNPD